MLSRRHLFYLVASVLVMSLLLVACERPIPGGDAATATPDVDAGGGVQPPAEEPPAEEPPAEEPPAEEPPAEEPPAEEPPAEEPPAEEPPAEEPPAEEPPAEEPTSSDTGSDTETVAVIPATHTVAAGENLYRIGLKYGLSWRDIAQLNRINPHRIYVGQVLQLPGGDTGGGPTETTYVVRRGDNLYRIGRRFGVSWIEIAEANGLANPNQIYVGQTLKIPVSTPGPTPQFSHLVRPGQTLFRISMQYGVPWLSIAQANSINPPYTIYVGQTLVIPGS